MRSSYLPIDINSVEPFILHKASEVVGKILPVRRHNSLTENIVATRLF
jgi:hypothetical protein